MPTSRSARSRSADRPTTCPWCSATVPPRKDVCPSCGATLAERVAEDIPGVTQVDPRPPLLEQPKRQSRIAAWLSGDRGAPEADQKVEPPSNAVRREMLRLELAAIDAEIEAKTAQVEAERVARLAEKPEPDAPG